MHKVYSIAVLTTGEIGCNECSWKGKGGETEQEHLYLTDAIELYCPNCHHYLGFINDARED